MRTYPFGIMFHHLHDSYHVRGQGSISADQFESILKHVGIGNILPAEDWLSGLLKNTLKPNQACVTFDDSLLCQYEIALPVLERYNMTAFWFVYTKVLTGETEKLEIFRKFRSVFFQDFSDFHREFVRELAESEYWPRVEKSLKELVPSNYLQEYSFYSDDDRRFRYLRDVVLNPQEYFQVMDLMITRYVPDVSAFCEGLWMKEKHIKSLHQNGHVIGLHSHTHLTDIAAMDKKGQHLEYSTNYQELLRLTCSGPRTVAHPVNSYNATSLEVLRELGIVAGFRDNDIKGFGSEYLELPRIDHMTILKECVS